MYRFCRTYDEDESAYSGGTTLCECCTKALTCRYLNDWAKKRKEKRQSEELVDEDEVGLDEFEQADQSRDLKRKPSGHDSKESKNCCVICCKAVFCCKTRNTVDKEMEMSDLRGRARAADEQEQDALLGDDDLAGDKEQLSIGETGVTPGGGSDAEGPDKETPGPINEMPEAEETGEVESSEFSSSEGDM